MDTRHNKRFIRRNCSWSNIKVICWGTDSGSGTIDFLYTAASGNETANLLADVLTTEDAGDAQFELFLDTSGTKKVTFSGIVTGTSLSATTGDLETVSVSL